MVSLSELLFEREDALSGGFITGGSFHWVFFFSLREVFARLFLRRDGFIRVSCVCVCQEMCDGYLFSTDEQI